MAVGCGKRAAGREREVDLDAEAGGQAFLDAALETAAAGAPQALLFGIGEIAPPLEGEELRLAARAQRRLALSGRAGERVGRDVDDRLDKPARLEDLQLARPQQECDAHRRELGEHEPDDRDRRDACGDPVEPAARARRRRAQDAVSTSSANM